MSEDQTITMAAAAALIRQARADERERNGEMNRIVGRDFKDDLRAKVEALAYLHRRTDDTYWVRRDEVLALLDGDGDA